MLALLTGCTPREALKPTNSPAAPQRADLFAGMAQGSQWVMGTRLTMAVRARSAARSEELLARAFALVRRLDALLSNYQASSPLSLLNAGAGGPAVEVPAELFSFLQACQAQARATDGAFSVTVGPLVRLHRQQASPAPQAVALAVELSEHRLLQLTSPRTVRLPRAGMALDPGAAGKGYALDQVVAALRRAGARRAWLDFGGSSFYGLGRPPGRAGWPVLLRSNPEQVINLRDQALSSSMSLIPPKTGAGKATGHIVDPRTGQQVQVQRFAGVVASTATVAEVLSTALVVQPLLISRLNASHPGAQAVVQQAGQPAVYSAGFVR